MTKLHRIKNIQTYNLAVSDQAGTVCLVTPEKSTGHAGRPLAFITGLNNSETSRTDIKANSNTTEEVKAISVDEFVSKNDIKSVDFIRCDTEGSEMLILNGATNTIEKHKPKFINRNS